MKSKTSKMWNKEKVIGQPVDSQSIDHLIKLPLFVEDWTVNCTQSEFSYVKGDPTRKSVKTNTGKEKK